MTLCTRSSVLVLAAALSYACDAPVLPVPAEPNGDCSRDLVTALDRGDEGGVTELIARGAVVHCHKTMARLEDAIRDDRSDALALLLRAGVNPNRLTGEFVNERSINLAFEERLYRGRSLKVMRLLLEHGATPNQRDNYSWNPKTHYTDDDTKTPYLRYEVELTHATPLMAAVVAQDFALVTLLVEFAADVNAADAKGKTAFDYAREGRNQEITAVLERRNQRSPRTPRPSTGGAVPKSAPASMLR
jgi:hypothetical protein